MAMFFQATFHTNHFKLKVMESKEALQWWSELSMNEQEAYRLAHPFFSKMGKDYFGLHKTSITQLYEYFIVNDNSLCNLSD